MKKVLSLLLAALLLILSGCGNTNTPQPSEIDKDTSTQTSQNTDTATEKVNLNHTGEITSEPDGTSGILVIYFSRTGEQDTVGVIDKGNTAIVAEMIAEETGADLFEVLAEEDYYPYTYNELTDVAKKEQNEKARPAYQGMLPDLGAYSTIFIGAPVWCYDSPITDLRG